MPKGTRVGKCFDKLTGKGMDKGKAAAICQDSTGQALSTGRKPKTKDGKPIKSKGKGKKG